MLKNKFIYILSTICFIIITVLSSIDFWAFNDLFYKHEFKQNDTYDTIGISEEDLDNTKDVLLGYIKDDNEEEKRITDPTKKKDSLNDEIILLTYDKSTRKVSSILKDSSLISDN